MFSRVMPIPMTLKGLEVHFCHLDLSAFKYFRTCSIC